MKHSSIPSNQQLIKEFPFLLADPDKSIWVEGNCYSDCWFDEVPEGWRSLMYSLLKEIKPYLDTRYIKQLEVNQIKEKWAGLRFYYDLYFNTHKKKRINKKYQTRACKISYEIAKIVQKYEYEASGICINCGKPAKYMTRGYILPYCEYCVDKSWNITEI